MERTQSLRYNSVGKKKTEQQAELVSVCYRFYHYFFEDYFSVQKTQERVNFAPHGAKEGKPTEMGFSLKDAQSNEQYLGEEAKLRHLGTERTSFSFYLKSLGLKY